MREKLIIRSLREDIDRFIRNYDSFNNKWVSKESDDFIIILSGYLDDTEFKAFLEYLKLNIDYCVTNIVRKYTKEELNSAQLFKMWISATFEPTGEEVGTQYDYPCKICKAGRIVIGDLFLKLNKFPQGKDIAKTIAEDEWIINERFANILINNNVKGVRLSKVKDRTRSKLKVNYYQLFIDNTVTVAEGTMYGDAFNPCKNKNKIITICGHTIQHILYSELFVNRNSWYGDDMVKTNLYFGGHINLIYPYPYIMISQRLYQLLIKNNIKGYEIEIVNLVD